MVAQVIATEAVLEILNSKSSLMQRLYLKGCFSSDNNVAMAI
jgi:hypothetical protein